MFFKILIVAIYLKTKINIKREECQPCVSHYAVARELWMLMLSLMRVPWVIPILVLGLLESWRRWNGGRSMGTIDINKTYYLSKKKKGVWKKFGKQFFCISCGVFGQNIMLAVLMTKKLALQS